MPASDFYLTTEFSSLPKTLVIDEAGGFSTLLVDLLLSHGCYVNYFGVEKKEIFYYLSDKRNFTFLNSVGENEVAEKTDYLFYFPQDELALLNNVLAVADKSLAKIIVAAPFSSPRNETIFSLADNKKLNLRLVFFDCLFGPRITSGLLGDIFTKATVEKKVFIEGEPERVIYPIPAKDLVKELLGLVFSTETAGKKYYFQGEGIAFFSFTSCLKKIMPEGDFVFSGSSEEKGLSKKGLEKIEINFDLEGEIQETYDWFRRNSLPPREPVEKEEEQAQNKVLITPIAEFSEEKQTQEAAPSLKKEPEKAEKKLDFLFSLEEKKKKEKKEKSPPTFFKKILLGAISFFCLLFVFFLLPLGLSLTAGLIGVKRIISVKTQVEKGNFSYAIREVESARKLLSFSEKTTSIISPFYGLVGADKPVALAGEIFSFSENLTDSLKFSLLTAKEMMELTKLFLNEEDVRWTEVLGPIKANISLAYEQASLAQSLLVKIEPGFKFFKQQDRFEQLKTSLPEAREILLKGEKLITIFPQLLGVGDKRTYLVLFQNNMEIRPTGGFIGSYGLVRLENGKLIGFEVYDVYQADGQLKGHVEPPVKLKEYMGEATWYLRDSNWDPDFPTSARRTQWFLDKETQVSVDGTIAINLEVAKKILAAIGEVELTDYHEKINQGNLFQKAEYYSELGTFPGSTQKKDFLGSLAKAILERIKQAKPGELSGVAGALFSSLEEKEMLLYSNDLAVESVLAGLNWDGSIRSYLPKSGSDSVFADYFYLNEANIGVNKANYFVQRKIDHQIAIKDTGKVEEKLTVTYENQSPSENWPAGDYKNYLRLFLKKEAKLTSVFISDPKNSGLWLPFDGKYIDSAEEHGKAVYGFLVEVPIKSKMKIEINYELSDSLDLSKRLTSYLLLAQKQSGAHLSDYSLTVSYPGNFVPLRVIPSAVVGNQKLLVTKRFNKDLIFQIDLAH